MASFTFDLKIMGAKNMETKHIGNLFIRCYLSSSNRKVHVNTKKVASSQTEDCIFWNESFLLECKGTEDSILDLKQQSMFLELRRRNMKTFLGILGGSLLLATAELPWKNVFDAPSMEIQRWVYMSAEQQGGNRVLKLKEGVKPPAVQIAMKIEVQEVLSMDEMRKMKRRERLMRRDECGCRRECCSSCVDNELLLIGLALDDF